MRDPLLEPDAVQKDIEPDFPAGTVAPLHQDPFDPLDSPVPALLLSAIITLVVAIVDLRTHNMNVSIIYILPMALCARTNRRSTIWLAAVVLMVLSYLGYYAGPWSPDSPTWRQMFLSYRMLNRTVSVIAIAAIASLTHFELSFRRRMDRRVEPWRMADAERDVFLEVLHSFENFRTTMTVVLVTACVGFTDMVTPGQYNPAIAYSVPLLVCARAQSRKLLWFAIALAVLLTFAGYYWGPPPEVAPDIVYNVRRNRIITASVIVVLGLLVHVWIGSDRPRSARRHAGAVRTLPPTDA